MQTEYIFEVISPTVIQTSKIIKMNRVPKNIFLLLIAVLFQLTGCSKDDGPKKPNLL